MNTTEDLLNFVGGRRFATVLADPPWQFENRSGKVAPEHKRLARYKTLPLEEICALPVKSFVLPTAHLWLWVPNALLISHGARVMEAWGFEYKTNIVWHKIRKDGGSDGRGVGFYLRNVTELLLLGVRGKGARTLELGRRQVNYIGTMKREHSRKPDEQYPIIEGCSPGPFIELFVREAWWEASWGDEVVPPSSGSGIIKPKRSRSWAMHKWGSARDDGTLAVAGSGFAWKSASDRSMEGAGIAAWCRCAHGS
jgi:N6-adenosine-specific RNA methylase IME4